VVGTSSENEESSVTPARFTLLSDRPNVKRGDPLAFDQRSDDLTGMILDARTSSPFTLGIEGGWGTGKSSLMARIRANLEDAGVKTVWFDAWTADEGQALEGVIKATLTKLDRNILRRLARSSRAKGWLRLVTTLFAGWFHIGSLVDEIWKAMEADPASRNQFRSLLEKEMQRWATKDPGSPQLLVVFIDDLDRCSPGNVFQIFEAVKLYLASPGFVFVIGFDKSIVSEAVLQAKQYASSVKSIDYLEKIVQISYRLPPPSEDEAIGLIDTYLRASGITELFADPALKALVIDRSGRNPRRIKRLVNSITLDYGLDVEWKERGVAALVRVELLLAYFPEFGEVWQSSAENDPVQQFLDYVDVKHALNQAPDPDDAVWSTVDEFSERYKLPRAIREDPETSEKRLERDLPPCYPALAHDHEFADLLRGLGTSAEREQLRQKLQRTRLSIEVTDARQPVLGAGFKTLPAPTGEYPYHLDLGDILDASFDDTDQVTFHAVGSTGGVRSPRPQKRVAEEMRRDASARTVAFFYHLGDVVFYHGQADGYFSQFYEPYADYLCPIFAIPGNHDADNTDDPETPSLSAFVRNFCASEWQVSPEAAGCNRATMTQPNVYWTLDAPLVRIIGLYTNVTQGGQLDSDQIRWFEQELRAAPLDRALIVALHRDPFSTSNTDSPRMATLLDEAFTRTRRVPDLILSGDTMNYQRFCQERGDKRLIYVVAGAGGYHNLRRLAADGPLPLTHKPGVALEAFKADTWGFLRITVSSVKIIGEYVAVPLEGDVVDPFDTFTIDLEHSHEAQTDVAAVRH
jgi:hypothetical protein